MNSSRYTRLIVALLATLVVFAVATGALQLLTDELGPGRLQRGGRMSGLDTKRELAWKLGQQGVALDTLILGNSTAEVGFDPAVLSEKSAGSVSAFNGGLAGYDYEVHRPFYHRVYEPLVRPHRVVVAVSMIDANRNEKHFRGNVDALLRSPLWPLYLGESPGNLQGHLSEIPGPYRYAISLQYNLRVFLRCECRPDPFGILRESAIEDLEEPPAEVQLSFFEDYSVGGRSWRSLVSLLGELREQGKDVLVVNMPLSPRLSFVIDEFGKDYLSYISALKSLCNQTSCRLLNAHEILELPIPAFTDLLHVNDTGRRAISELVASVLIEGPREERRWSAPPELRMLPGSGGEEDHAHFDHHP